MLDLEEVQRRIQTARESKANELDLSGSCLQDLNLLTQLDDVRVLMLNDSVDLTDLSGLINTSLPSLAALYLNGCRNIDDLTPLTQCSLLTELSLRDCISLRDISPLSTQTWLRYLDLSGCENVTDLAPLIRHSLDILDLSGCRSVRDFSPIGKINIYELTLEDLPEIHLEIAFTQIYRSKEFVVHDESITILPSEIGQLDSLETLDFSGCRSLCDIKQLAALSTIRELNLGYCLSLNDLTPLANLANLRSLCLKHCFSLADLSPLAGLKTLRQLDLEGCANLFNLSPLKDLNELTELNLRDCPNVTDLSPLENLKFARITCSAVSVTSVEQWKDLMVAAARELKTKLLDVCQNLVITEHDCGGPPRMTIGSNYRGDFGEFDLKSAVLGRVVGWEKIDSPISGETIVEENEIITPELAQEVAALGIQTVAIRTPLYCESAVGVCRLCYGMDFDTGELVEVGKEVGLIAAEAIGEVERELKLRMKSGSIDEFSTEPVEPRRSEPGSASDSNLAVDQYLQSPGNCLKELFELFEAKRPEHAAVLAEWGGQITIESKQISDQIACKILIQRDDGCEWESQILPGTQLLVKPNDHVRAGDPLTTGEINPHDVLRILGEEAVSKYLTERINEISRIQGMVVDNRHTEIILAQMLHLVQVYTSGDTGLARGTVLDRIEFRQFNHKLSDYRRVTDKGDSEYCEGDIVPSESIEEANLKIQAAGRNPCRTAKPRSATAEQRLLGISEVALCKRIHK